MIRLRCESGAAGGTLQLRYHPLTGEEVRINARRACRPKQGSDGVAAEAAEAALQQVVQAARATNPFSRRCIFERVPTFPAEICPEGRFLKGEAVLFPNLNPFAENHAVVVICEEDFLEIEQFKPSMVVDALHVTMQYFHAVIQCQQKQAQQQQQEEDQKLTCSSSDDLCGYPTCMWNYLPPSAGSIIHPHFQVFLENRPLPALKNILDKCESYSSTTNSSSSSTPGGDGGNFYADFITLELQQCPNERVILQTKDVVVLASFAPRGLHEVGFYFPGVSSLLDLSEGTTQQFAEVLLRVLRAYRAALGVRSFNVTSFSAPSKVTHPHSRFDENFMLHFRLFARPDPKGLYTNDTGPMERVYDSWVIDSIPELVASALRDELSKQ